MNKHEIIEQLNDLAERARDTYITKHDIDDLVTVVCIIKEEKLT